MRKYGESKTTRIMMATVPHVTFGSGLRKFQADGFLFDRVYNCRSRYFHVTIEVGLLFSLLWTKSVFRLFDNVLNTYVM